MRLIISSSWLARTLLGLIISSPCAICSAQQPTTTTLYVPSEAGNSSAISVAAQVLPVDAAADRSSNGIKFTWTSPGQPPQSTIAFPTTENMGFTYIQMGPLTPGTYTVQAFYLGLTSNTPGASYLPSQSAPMSVTVTAFGSQSAMTGRYAFLYQGFSTAGGVYSASAAVGSFNADGQGNVTDGVLDLVTGADGYVHSPTMTGSYALGGSTDSTLTLRAPGLGVQTMQLSSSSAVTAGQIKQHFVANLSGGPLYGSMQIERQNPGDFAISAVDGYYNLRLSGVRSGNPPLPLSGATTLFLKPEDGFTDGFADFNETIGTTAYLDVPNRSGFSAPDPTTGAFTVGFASVGAYPACLLPNAGYQAYLIDTTHFFVLEMPFPRPALSMCSAALPRSKDTEPTAQCPSPDNQLYRRSPLRHAERRLPIFCIKPGTTCPSSPGRTSSS